MFGYIDDMPPFMLAYRVKGGGEWRFGSPFTDGDLGFQTFEKATAQLSRVKRRRASGQYEFKVIHIRIEDK